MTTYFWVPQRQGLVLGYDVIVNGMINRPITAGKVWLISFGVTIRWILECGGGGEVSLR